VNHGTELLRGWSIMLVYGVFWCLLVFRRQFDQPQPMTIGRRSEGSIRWYGSSLLPVKGRLVLE
jgi:hypothetical protein